jgi:predicted Rossmann fold flavoprotein
VLARERPAVVVVGAGAAGLVAAIFAARERPPGGVLLLERTRDGGRKILVSGGGRCNVLPQTIAPERFVTDSSPHTLRKLLLAWPLAEQIAFFERDAGVPLVLEEESAKYFPASHRARDVRDALLELARAAGVEIRFAARLVGLSPASPRWRLELEGGESLSARSVVLATGGLSLPGTGSDGAGLTLLAELGHALHPTYPALTPLLGDAPAHRSLSGLSRSVTLRAPRAGAGGRPRVATGGFLFTHRGYSGPVVLDLSHLAVRSRARPEPQRLEVQWSELSAADWEAALTSGPGGTPVGSVLERHLQERLSATLLEEAGVERRTPLARLPRGARLRLVTLLARYPLPWTGDEGYAKAEVTGGGVALGEIEPRTLASRRHAGIFLCGELLDAFGPIGGHNFSWAWSTGRAAGQGAARYAASPS